MLFSNVLLLKVCQSLKLKKKKNSLQFLENNDRETKLSVQNSDLLRRHFFSFSVFLHILC